MRVKLPVRMVSKPWGREELPLPFKAPAHERIGEVWFEPDAAHAQLLIKYIFTSEALLVQVHPSDAQTLQAGLGRQGKEECWLVVAAQPGAALGIGFRAEIAPKAMLAAAIDGSIVDILEWFPVTPGDFFYIPANTVHAIGAGVGLIEIQQNSDITYRLYDYGRPRELHLEAGMAVARGEPHDPALRRKVPERGLVTLVDGPLFRLDRIDGPPAQAIAKHYDGALLVVPLDNPVQIAGEEIAPGECALAPALDAISITGRCLIAQPVV